MAVLRAAMLVVLAGCLDPEAEDQEPLVDPELSGDCPEEGEGELSLALEVPPARDWRQAPVAVILGADGSEVARVSESGTLSLPAGRYTVEVWRGETASTGVAGELWTAERPIVSLCVPDGGSEERSVRWTAAPGALWVSSGASLGAFTAEQVEEGGAQEPSARLDVRLVNDFRGFAFDRMGHLWAATGVTYGTRLLWFDAERRQGRGEREPVAELTSPVFADFADISDVLFDERGDLWVALSAADGSFDGLVGFSRQTLDEALLGGANLEVAPDWERPIDGLTGQVDLELGPDGALWLTFFDGDQLLRIDDPRDGATEVDAAFSLYTHPETASEPLILAGPENLAFEDDGDAIALFWGSAVVVNVEGEALSADGARELLLPEGDAFSVLALPSGLVIDGAGRAWMGNYAGNGTGEILAWSPGSGPEPWLMSAELTDPTDLVLDPRPR